MDDCQETHPLPAMISCIGAFNASWPQTATFPHVRAFASGLFANQNVGLRPQLSQSASALPESLMADDVSPLERENLIIQRGRHLVVGSLVLDEAAARDSVPRTRRASTAGASLPRP